MRTLADELAVNDKCALAVVIGRAGSRGLPGKNARNLVGKPMIVHTIEDAQQAVVVNRVIVSTDGEAIAQAARACGVDVITRPPELATDTASVSDAVRHAVETDGGNEPIVVILYANVPIRPNNLIDRAVTKLIETAADSVQSYAPVGKYHPQWMSRIEDDDRVKAYLPGSVDRRQDLPPLFIPDGGVIAVRRDTLLSASHDDPHAFFGEDRRAIETDVGSVIDVDTEFDCVIAETTLKRERAEAAT